MLIFPQNIHFNGDWRPYQKRVLDNLKTCMDDHKVHIVAAPGSGKTTVGLEILLRLGQPAIILAPSITIREQWIDRFSTSFLPDNEPTENWISNSIRKPKAITVITYQALHSAYNCLANQEKDDDGEETVERESVDYKDFNLISTLKNAGVRTVCMDEAHHLRSEWWKALEKVVSELGDSVTTVSLTATPPYDSTPSEWQRYINLCGEIDMEIFTPELAKEHNLCPHQDYVYFNWPESDEIQAIQEFRESAYVTAFDIAKEPEFILAIRSHPGLTNVEAYSELFLDHPNYLTSIMVFLRYNKIEFPKELQKLIGTKEKLPALDLTWLEVLLQGFLYDDCASYPNFVEYQEDIRKRLSKLGHIQRKTVILSNSDEINRLLITSKGKLNSIREIVHAEYASLGGQLRLLVLTDYIKKDLVSMIGKTEAEIDSIGVIPIFEILRREKIPGLKIGVLSGGIVIVPRDGTDEMDAIAAQKGVQLRYHSLNCPDYVEVEFTGTNQKMMVSVMTDFFTKGGVNALIGTKSLLGEGWDSPCINSLILASFVGSYMLSNQMRGRAIRVFPGVPDKTANIWHLISMEPLWAYSTNVRERILSRFGSSSDYPVSEDFAMLRRRFKSFLGVSYTDDLIEDGISRLSIIKPPYDKQNIETINRQMLKMAADRQLLMEKWQRAIEQCPDASQVVAIDTMDKALVPHRFAFFNAVACFGGITFVQALLLFITKAMSQSISSNSSAFMLFLILLILICVFGSLMVKNIIRIIQYFSPQSCLKQMGTAMLKALKSIGAVESFNAKVITESSDNLLTVCYLEGGTTHEKNIFCESMSQLMGFIDNPRYLLILHQKNLFLTRTEYFSVPDIFGNKKENAETLVRCMQRLSGNYELVFTRNAEGRKILLKARTKSFVNKNNHLLDKSHKVKTKWE
ncbi:MAG TPA: DEAD/DEAH box helicase family protein [Oscillospiraceae bacterium]|nr:DEAD/DEAH box helicase family protein [Oscillospiraceae bacterium]